MAKGVSAADVWSAADALLRDGEQPTVERVRLHLGRGSPNTVGPHLKAWFRGLGQRLLAGQGAASSIPQVVTHAIEQVWETALSTAREESAAAVALERAELAQARAALDSEHAALEQERERLRVREADLEASAAAARGQAAAAEARLQTAERQAQESALTLKDTQGQLAAAREQLASLQQTLQSTQASHQEALAAAEARHAAHERRWLGEIDEQRQALRKAQDELERARKTAAALNTAHKQALEKKRADIDALTQRAILAETQVRELTVQLASTTEASRTAQSHWENTLSQLTAQIETLREQLATKDRQIELLVRAGDVRNKDK